MRSFYFLFCVTVSLLFVHENVLVAQVDQHKVDSLNTVIRSKKDPLTRAQAYKSLGKIYLSAYDLNHTDHYTRKALAISQRKHIDSLSLQCYKMLGVSAIYQGKTDSSLHFMHLSNQLAHKLKDSSALAKNYGIISNIYNQFLNQPDMAFVYIDSAELYYREDQIQERVFGKIVKGSIFVNVSSYLQALNEFYAGLDLVEDDSSQINSLYTNIGTVFKATGDYPRALKSFEEAIKFSKGDPRSLGIIYHDMALAYRLQRKEDKAIEAEKKAIEYLSQLGINNYLFQAQLNAGQLYHDLGQKEKAFAMFESIDNSGLQAQEELLWYTLGAVIGYPGFSFDVLDKSFREKQSLSSADVLMDISDHMYKHYKKVGNIQKALYYKEVHSDFKDSLLAQHKIVEVQRINLNRIVDKKNEELHQQEQEAISAQYNLALEEERSKRWKYSLVLLIALGCLGAFVFYQRASRRKEQLRKKEEELAKEQRQRRLLLDHLDEARAQLKANRDQLDELSSKTDSSEVLMETLDDRNWPNFLSEFELVYPEFFKKLDDLTVTKLTKNERRLCCLIKLNLSNKEIAEYVFVSPESVKKAKNRLFKKFDTRHSESMISDIIRSL